MKLIKLLEEIEYLKRQTEAIKRINKALAEALEEIDQDKSIKYYN